jgi:hypothetical protein
MKKILCLALILFAYIAVSAQEKTITQAEFDAVHKTSIDKWKGKSYRMVYSTQSNIEGRPEASYSSKNIIEFASPTHSRSISESTLNSKTTRTEDIRIGDKTYKRIGDGKWQEGVFQPYTPRIENKPPVANQEESQIEYKYFGTEKLNNQTANVYVVTKKVKGINSSNNKEYLHNIVNKYWFSQDGLILKLHMEMETRTLVVTARNNLIHTWELDPNIKIEAPNLNEIK